jgi:XapX domain-containing protein
MQSNVRRGTLAGLVAGIVFGVLLSLFTVRTPAGNRVIMMELVGEMTGTKSLMIGWAYHLFDSIVMGAIFGALVGTRVRSYQEGFKFGPLFGLTWWILGGLFLMPILLGMSLFSPQTIEPVQPVALQSLLGHLVFGLILGGVFAAMKSTESKAQVREIREKESEQRRFKVG